MPSLYAGATRNGGPAATEPMPESAIETEGEVVELFELAALAHILQKARKCTE